MGGSGSTRWGRFRPPPMVVEDCRWTLDADYFHRAGVFGPPICAPYSGRIFWMDGASIAFTLESDGASGIMLTLLFARGEHINNQTILLQCTGLYSGGLRWWFTCPYLCKRRVRKLYLMHGHSEYGCRNCHGLTHDCRRRGYNSRSRINTLLAREYGRSIQEVRKRMSALRKWSRRRHP